MKRLLSIFLTVSVLLSSLGQTAIAAAPTSGTIDAPYGANYFADSVITEQKSFAVSTEEETTDAEDTDSADVSLSYSTDDAIYFGFEEEFDGASFDLATAASGGAYTVEYLTGSDWTDASDWSTLVSSTTADIKNNSDGAFQLTWDRPSNWTKGTIDIDMDESGAASTSDSLYFARLRVTSDYSDYADFSQIGLLVYNAVFSVKDELGNEMTNTLTYQFADSTGAAAPIYSEKTDGNETYMALDADTGINFTYSVGVSGFVTNSDESTIDKSQTVLSETLKYAHRINAVDENGDYVTIKEAYAGKSDTVCVISGISAYCAVPYNEDGSSETVTIISEKYAATEADLKDRTAATSAQEYYDVTVDWAYLITVKNKDDELITNADVTIDDTDCDNLGSGKYGCALEVNTDGDIEVMASGYKDYNSSITVRTNNSDDQVTKTVTMTKSGSSDGIDLVADDIYLNSDDEILVRVANEGDEDVDSDTRVYIYMYVDGSLKWTKSSKNTSSSSYLNAGTDQSFNTGVTLSGSSSHTVKLYVDYTDAVDEDDEDNNYRSESLSAGNNGDDDDDDDDDNNKPDLEVTNIEKDGSNITFTVKNTGDGYVASDAKVYTTLYIDGDAEKTWSSEKEDFFRPGYGNNFTAKNVLSGLDRGVYEIKVCTDTGKDVSEDSESNNCDSEDILVTGKMADDDDENISCRSPFTDIRNHFAEKSICLLYNMGVVQGRDRTHFEPNDKITRAEFLKMMLEIGKYRVREVDSADKYSDVSESDWFYPYVTFATDMGFVNGYTDSTFRPNEEINRAEAMVLIMRLAHKELWNFSQRDIPFRDVDRDDWYAYAVVIAFRNGIIEGYGDRTFGADRDLTRGEAAVMLRRTWYAFYK